MVEPLRHRQTKEAATDMFGLQPPRHISTLTRLPRLRTWGVSGVLVASPVERLIRSSGSLPAFL